MMENWISFLKENTIVRYLRDRMSSIVLTRDLAVRLRLVFFLTAILALFLAFEMGDDWYVREFANYDWARHIGY
jgi:hypothetical protein